MIFVYLWIFPVAVLVNLLLSAWIILKMGKLEKFQTGEAHANLQLMNQSLNHLSDIAEMFEKQNHNSHVPDRLMGDNLQGNSDFDKEQKALALIRQGENPKHIGRKLGISRSEMELLVASEKLGNGSRPSRN